MVWICSGHHILYVTHESDSENFTKGIMYAVDRLQGGLYILGINLWHHPRLAPNRPDRSYKDQVNIHRCRCVSPYSQQIIKA